MDFPRGMHVDQAQQVVLGRQVEGGWLAAHILGTPPEDLPSGLRRGTREQLQRMVAEGKAAEATLLTAAGRYVRSVAIDRARRFGNDIDDMVGVAMTSMVDSLGRWDYRQASFLTFAGTNAKWACVHASGTQFGTRPYLDPGQERTSPQKRPLRAGLWRGEEADELHLPTSGAFDPTADAAIEAADRGPLPDVQAALAQLAPIDQRIMTMRYGLDGSPPAAQRTISGATGLTLRQVRGHLDQSGRTMAQLLGTQPDTSMPAPPGSHGVRWHLGHTTFHGWLTSAGDEVTWMFTGTHGERAEVGRAAAAKTVIADRRLNPPGLSLATRADFAARLAAGATSGPVAGPGPPTPDRPQRPAQPLHREGPGR